MHSDWLNNYQIHVFGCFAYETKMYTYSYITYMELTWCIYPQGCCHKRKSSADNVLHVVCADRVRVSNAQQGVPWVTSSSCVICQCFLARRSSGWNKSRVSWEGVILGILCVPGMGYDSYLISLRLGELE